MKLLPYFSPFYYSGADFFAEVRRALDEYQVDGLYYDGIRGDLRPANLHRTLVGRGFPCRAAAYGGGGLVSP